MEDNWFTILCWFLLYNNINQPVSIHMSPPYWTAPHSLHPSRLSQNTGVNSLSLYCKSSPAGYITTISTHAQLCLTLWDPMDCSPPGSSVCGIFQQAYWSGLPFPAPKDILDPRIEPQSPSSPTLASGFLATVPPGKRISHMLVCMCQCYSLS